MICNDMFKKIQYCSFDIIFQNQILNCSYIFKFRTVIHDSKIHKLEIVCYGKGDESDHYATLFSCMQFISDVRRFSHLNRLFPYV